MNTRYEDDTDLHEPLQRDREISLGAATILGIFFVLALICAVFFGFGYTLGRRSAQQQPSAISSEPAATLSSNSSKPSPGSAAITAPSSSKYASEAPATPTTRTVALDSPPATPPAKPAATLLLATKPTPPPIPTVAPSTPGAVLVQVAAVSHQEDADILLSALKKRGYAVTIRHEPQDKLLHVQIGPFATKKDAEAMRQRLLSDGYNAMVK
ncbi:MAG TPA: SPOR domain-containing protein [Edaphobacter sp.]